MRLAPGWRPWVLIPFGIGMLSLPLGWIAPIGWALPGLAFALALSIAFFFRDPDRRTGQGIVAAADGKIKTVRRDAIVTFLNVHNVHVIRAPYAGTIDAIHRFEGPHRPAFLDGAEHNAGLAISIDTSWGLHEVHFFTGLVARRAVAFVEEEDWVEKGERIGMIRFGSRVDVELPPGAKPQVSRGETARAAETRIASTPPAESEASS